MKKDTGETSLKGLCTRVAIGAIAIFGASFGLIGSPAASANTVTDVGSDLGPAANDSNHSGSVSSRPAANDDKY